MSSRKGRGATAPRPVADQAERWVLHWTGHQWLPASEADREALKRQLGDAAHRLRPLIRAARQEPRIPPREEAPTVEAPATPYPAAEAPVLSEGQAILGRIAAAQAHGAPLRESLCSLSDDQLAAAREAIQPAIDRAHADARARLCTLKGRLTREAKRRATPQPNAADVHRTSGDPYDAGAAAFAAGESLDANPWHRVPGKGADSPEGADWHSGWIMAHHAAHPPEAVPPAPASPVPVHVPPPCYLCGKPGDGPTGPAKQWECREHRLSRRRSAANAAAYDRKYRQARQTRCATCRAPLTPENTPTDGHTRGYCAACVEEQVRRARRIDQQHAIRRAEGAARQKGSSPGAIALAAQLAQEAAARGDKPRPPRGPLKKVYLSHYAHARETVS